MLPFLDKRPHGIFATRPPKRPDHVGLSVMEPRGVAGDNLLLDNVDVLDGTPVIDIKPHVPDFDVWPADRVGWFEEKSGNAASRRSDGRFAARDKIPAADPEPVEG